MDIHTCNFHCLRPACIASQRDELRDRLFSVLATLDAPMTSGEIMDAIDAARLSLGDHADPIRLAYLVARNVDNRARGLK